MSERPVESWAGCTGHLLRVLDAGDDAAARVYTTLLPLSDGRVPVGHWAISDLAAAPPAAPDCGDSETRHHHYQPVIRA